MRKIKITLSYDGTNYVGWQVQPNGVSIQGLLEDAVCKITGSPADVIGAGRTDAGVHALGQVAHFEIESGIPCYGLKRGLNSNLPPDIVILNAEDVDPTFHARRDAVAKCYRYRLLTGDQRCPLFINKVWQLRERLDIDAMSKAALKLIGEHDFESFRASGCTSAHAVRNLKNIEILKMGEGDWHLSKGDELIEIAFEGDGFVRHMVRNIVGTLVEVGRGNLDEKAVSEILDKKNRQVAPICAPACGLYLVRVYY